MESVEAFYDVFGGHEARVGIGEIFAVARDGRAQAGGDGWNFGQWDGAEERALRTGEFDAPDFGGGLSVAAANEKGGIVESKIQRAITLLQLRDCLRLATVNWKHLVLR